VSSACPSCFPGTKRTGFRKWLSMQERLLYPVTFFLGLCKQFLLGNNVIYYLLIIFSPGRKRVHLMLSLLLLLVLPRSLFTVGSPREDLLSVLVLVLGS